MQVHWKMVRGEYKKLQVGLTEHLFLEAGTGLVAATTMLFLPEEHGPFCKQSKTNTHLKGFQLKIVVTSDKMQSG